jgi:hypothetical protein
MTGVYIDGATVSILVQLAITLVVVIAVGRFIVHRRRDRAAPPRPRAARSLLLLPGSAG